MDTSLIASASTAFSSAQLGDVVQTSVLKKAMDVESQSVLALINALPQPAANLPAHLGQNVNTVA